MTIPRSIGFLSDDSCLPLTPEEERRAIQLLERAASSNRKEGDQYCLVSATWWNGWKDYVGLDESSGLLAQAPLAESIRPGQIDNSELLSSEMDDEKDELTLREGLIEQIDYILVPLDVWKKLKEWYGGGPTIVRKLISRGQNNRELSVEVYLLCLRIIHPKKTSPRTIYISKKARVNELYDRICELFKLGRSKIRIWDYFNQTKQKLLSETDESLEEVLLSSGQEILIEELGDGISLGSGQMDSTGNRLALAPIEPQRSSITIAGGPTVSNRYSTGSLPDLAQESSSGLWSSDTQRDSSSSSSSKVDSGGLTGLLNLGNTCFMNSAIQCLVHTPQLVEYFLGDFTFEINKSNPLGMQGELAIAFGDLLRQLWSSSGISVAPRLFKGKLARFAPQFSGYNQHDSQELLAFLLDGLHEDLNRVKNKPYIEAKSANGRPDEEFADECWRNHKARNDSIIVDVCQGQYKSTLVCPTCSKVSVTFDPFMYLSLPLPSSVTRTITATVVYSDGSRLPIPTTVTVPKQGSCRDLLQAIGIACCLSQNEELILVEVLNHRIHRYYERPLLPLTHIKDEDHLVAYRLPSKQEKSTRLEITHRKKDRLFGTPLVACLPEGAVDTAGIRAAAGVVLSPLFRGKSAKFVSRSSKERENGHAREEDDEDEDEDENDAVPSFELAGAEDRNSFRDSSSGAAKRVKIFLDWTEKEQGSYDLSFLDDLPEVYKHTGFFAKKTRQEGVNLFSCLEAFLREEPLGPDDMWYCPGCKKHRQATKKLDLWRLPEILVIHLKRFSYNRFMKNKLDTFVNFPVTDLDLGLYVMNKSTSPKSLAYELYAVINHYGGLGGGHYTAYAKLTKENRWYHFDDSHVSPVNGDSVRTSAAYVLFYRRVDSGDTPMQEAEASGSGSAAAQS
ncbi:ubiquitin carboxyl-terminal hydrolase 9-like [Wolffia australiana]